MHIAPTGFPRHLTGSALFIGRNRFLASIGDGSRVYAGRSDPDQFLDDVFDRVEGREATLGNDPVSRTIGLFEL
jgi:hypothetical protein